MSPQKHVRLSPRPSTSYAPYPSPTYTNAIAAAQHNVNLALGTSPNFHHHHHQQQQAQQHTVNGMAVGSISSITPLNLSHSAPQPSASGGLTMHHHHHQMQQQHLHHQQQQQAPQQHRSPLSPNRRTRGENKKCRKVYGMEHKDLWCTQCKWKKACSRFGDWKRTTTVITSTAAVAPPIIVATAVDLWLQSQF